MLQPTVREGTFVSLCAIISLAALAASSLDTILLIFVNGTQIS